MRSPGGGGPTAAAPTTTVETVSVVRPLKVIALVCLVLAVLLQLVALATSYWLTSGATRIGLFQECTMFVKAVAALLVIGVILLLAAAILTGAGLASRQFNRKYLYYRIALFIALFAVLVDLVSLLTFPICFYFEMAHMERTIWEFDWSYGLAWGAALFIFGAALLLICDKEHEEVYYKEKMVYNTPPGNV